MAGEEERKTTILVEVPEGVLQKFGETPGIRSRLALEALAIECYRTRALSNPLCARLLQMTGIEFQQMLRARSVPSNLPVEQFLRGYRALKSLTKK